MGTQINNTYLITFKNNQNETVSAENMISALNNVENTEFEIVQASIKLYGVKTVVEDTPSIKELSCVIADALGDVGNKVTPKSAIISVGNIITLQAFSADHYKFSGWYLDNVLISEDEIHEWTVPDTEDTFIEITAYFKLAPVKWEAVASPEDAVTAGCIAFPYSGENEVGDEISLIAVKQDGWAFDHWESRGVSLGTDNILAIELPELTEDEEKLTLTAVFKEST